jgi:hypothetical protein
LRYDDLHFDLQNIVTRIAQQENGTSKTLPWHPSQLLHPYQKQLHPAKMEVAKKFTNPEHGRHLSDLICLREEEKMVTRKLQVCYVFRHSEFEGKELHAIQ